MTICERQSGGRILCIRLSGLGDIVHTMNALTLLRQERPDAYIAWLVEDRFASLLKDHPYIDEVLTVPRTLWGPGLKNPLKWWRVIPEMAAFRRLLRSKRFDISIDFQSNSKSSLFVIPAGAALKVGFDRGVNKELNHLAQTHLVHAPMRGVHRVERYLALLAPLGIPTRYAVPFLPFSRRAKQSMDTALQGQLTGGPLVVIHPATSGFAQFKRWPAKRYARVADELVSRCGADVLVTYGPSDRHLAEDVVGRMRQRGLLAPPTGDIQELTYLLSRANLFIGSDTGPMHMAAARNTPVVALFGPKDEVQTGPYCSRSKVVAGRAACRPCTRRRCSRIQCMHSIGSDEVLAAALEVLGGGGERRADRPIPIGSFTSEFDLGKWRGEISTAFSTPEFYTRLCNPRKLVSEPTAVPIEAGRRRSSASIRGGPGAPDRRLIAETVSPRASLERWMLGLLFGSRSRRAWRMGRKLAMAGVPVAHPVCYMERGPGWRRRELLVFEDLSPVVSLRTRLTDAARGTGPGLSAEERDTLIEQLAGLVRSLHAAGFHHRDLRDTNVLVRGGDDDGRPALCLTGTEAVGRVRLPRPLSDLWYASDLRRLALHLAVPVSEEEARRFFRAYCEGFLTEGYRQRIVKALVRAFPRRHTEAGRLQPWLRAGCGETPRGRLP